MLANLMSKKRWERPTEGKHTVVIKGMEIEEYPNQNFEILVLHTILDKTREYDIRMFCRDDQCRDLDFLCKALIAMYGEGQSASELLNKVIEEEKEVPVWVYYNTSTNSAGETQEFTNHYWFEKVDKIQSTINIDVNNYANKELPI